MSSLPTAVALSHRRMPGLWHGVAWAFQRGNEGGGISRWRLVLRAICATLVHRSVLQRWMAIVFEHGVRGILTDLPGEYLRAIRPSVHRHTGIEERVRQLIDHTDWVETAFQPATLEELTSGRAVILAELRVPRGFDYLRLQVQRAGVQSPEGELLLTLTAQRSGDLQHKALPMDVGTLAFSRFRIDGTACLVIGGVRGQRSHASRMSTMEVSQGLQGWKPPVLLVCAMQELARAWGQELVGLNPGSHRLQGWSYRFNGRARASADRIVASYRALWTHFGAKAGPLDWLALPPQSDEQLAATALSPEMRERQTRRADFWIRTRKQLRLQMRELLLRQGREDGQSGVTQAMTAPGPLRDEWDDLLSDYDEDSEQEELQARLLQTGPAELQ